MMNTRRLTKDAAIEAVSREARLSFTTLSHYYRAYKDTAYRVIEALTKLSELLAALAELQIEANTKLRELSTKFSEELAPQFRLLDLDETRKQFARLWDEMRSKVIEGVRPAYDAIRRFNPPE